MQLIDEAEANPMPDQAQLKAIRENQKRRQKQIEEKEKSTQAAAKVPETPTDDKEKEQPLRGLAPDPSTPSQSQPDPPLGPIPNYPGRSLDPRGVSSILTQRVNQNMKLL